MQLRWMTKIRHRFERSDGMRGLVEGLTSFITYLASAGQARQIQGCLASGVNVIATASTATKAYRSRRWSISLIGAARIHPRDFGRQRLVIASTAGSRGSALDYLHPRRHGLQRPTVPRLAGKTMAAREHIESINWHFTSVGSLPCPRRGLHCLVGNLRWHELSPGKAQFIK